MKRIFLAAILFAAAGCSPAPHKPTAAELATLKPADAHAADLYEHSCKACHAQPGTGAPLVHDTAAWAPRWAQGEDVLLSHAVLGYRSMPAGGQCAACKSADYQAIIRFMADRGNEQ